jgi:hypothetical protein
LKDYEVHYTVVYRTNVQAQDMQDAKLQAEYAVKMRNGARAKVFKVLAPDHPERHDARILLLTDEVTDRRLKKYPPPRKNSPPRSIDDI